jgi:hypothetical protein
MMIAPGTLGTLYGAQNRSRWQVAVLRGPEKLDFFRPDLLRGALIIMYLFCKTAKRGTVYICMCMNLASHSLPIWLSGIELGLTDVRHV